MAAGPLNPPTLGRRRVGPFTGAGIACTVEKKLYGGRGLGLVGVPQMVFLAFKIGGVTVRKCGDGFGLRWMSKEAFGGLPESFFELQGGPKWSKWDQYLTNLSSREAKKGLKVSYE